MQLYDYNLEFDELTPREVTDLIVIHHTGYPDGDASAAQIHDWHYGQGWVGIGYHWVIRKDGRLEFGRPEWAVGSHCYGFNHRSIGIHLSGCFDDVKPTAAQIETCAELIRDICDDYNIPLHRANVKGHCELNETDCPGYYLYQKLDEILIMAQNL